MGAQALAPNQRLPTNGSNNNNVWRWARCTRSLCIYINWAQEWNTRCIFAFFFLSVFSLFNVLGWKFFFFLVLLFVFMFASFTWTILLAINNDNVKLMFAHLGGSSERVRCTTWICSQCALCMAHARVTRIARMVFNENLKWLRFGRVCAQNLIAEAKRYCTFLSSLPLPSSPYLLSVALFHTFLRRLLRRHSTRR